jgi:murein DD-endopeptidase MepM/ murein hydrolase activator NlpD
MRATLTFPVLAVVGLLAACSRPVLYYPTPESAGIKPTATPDATPAPATPVAPSMSASASSDVEYLRERHLLVPVAGADMSKVEDTFYEGRDGGERVHRAIDILAPRGTPILAADDGKILRMTTNALGGISMYTVDTGNRIVYYYAHMDHYNDVMSPGRTIVKGDTLGFVGTTGNAPKDTPHLHFQVMRWPADGKYWNGEPIDPYELLGGIPRGERAERGKHAIGQPEHQPEH